MMQRTTNGAEDNITLLACEVNLGHKRHEIGYQVYNQTDLVKEPILISAKFDGI